MLISTQIFAFLLASILITATPGPDNLMVLSMGMAKGRIQGIVFGLGCALGCVSHTILAVMGVSAIVAASPMAFTALKWAGGAYLIWLGIMALRGSASGNVVGSKSLEKSSLKALFFKGMFANAINPKVVLFFLSFLPQFVVTEQGSVELQLGILGLIFTGQAAVIFGLLGYFAGHIGVWLNRNPRAGLLMDRIAGAVFVGLGIRIIVSR
jgi:threonine/homoserine/homoserine lactone efflux protein